MAWMYLSGIHGYASEGLSVGSFNGQKMGVSLVRGEKKGRSFRPERTSVWERSQCPQSVWAGMLKHSVGRGSGKAWGWERPLRGILEGFGERTRHALPICRDVVASLVSLLCDSPMLDPRGAKSPDADSAGCCGAKSEGKFQIKRSR